MCYSIEILAKFCQTLKWLVGKLKYLRQGPIENISQHQGIGCILSFFIFSCEYSLFPINIVCLVIIHCLLFNSLVFYIGL